jgi:6-phosphogluconolactonase
MLRLHEYDNFDALRAALLAQWLDVIDRTPANAGASFALAGGSTPATLYRELDQALAQRDAGPHPIRLVATDERWVIDADAQSNEGLFRRCLAQSNRTAERWQLVSLKNAAATPEVAIEAIGTRLQQQFPDAFSAVLLGMGTDGHIASLFPHHPTGDDQQPCLAALHPQTRQSRISLSLPRLLNTERLWLLITGTDKRRVLEQATNSDLPIGALLRGAQCDVDAFWCPA